MADRSWPGPAPLAEPIVDHAAERAPGEVADAYTVAPRTEFEARIGAAGGFLEWAGFLDYLQADPAARPPAGAMWCSRSTCRAPPARRCPATTDARWRCSSTAPATREQQRRLSSSDVDGDSPDRGSVQRLRQSPTRRPSARRSPRDAPGRERRPGAPARGRGGGAIAAHRAAQNPDRRGQDSSPHGGPLLPSRVPSPRNGPGHGLSPRHDDEPADRGPPRPCRVEVHPRHPRFEAGSPDQLVLQPAVRGSRHRRAAPGDLVGPQAAVDRLRGDRRRQDPRRLARPGGRDEAGASVDEGDESAE